MSKVSSFLRRRILDPILDQLRQGASPVRLAWSVSLGAVIGVFPVLGTTTLLCGIAGAALRLNHVAMQAANYLVYALQFALVPVFIRAGEKISGAAPIAIDLAVMQARFSESPSGFFQDFGIAAWHGVLAWLVLMPIPAWAAAFVLTRAFNRVLQASSRRSSPNSG